MPDPMADPAPGPTPDPTPRAAARAADVADAPHDLPPAFFEMFSPALPRLGPGSPDATRLALRLARYHLDLDPTPPPDAPLHAIELGCGNGGATLVLAGEAVHVLAIDCFAIYLDELNRRAADAGLAERITTRRLDMARAHEDEQRYDLVWAEGSLYNIGFTDGVALARRLLRPGGVAAATELCWLDPEPPAEAVEYFQREYPAMTHAADAAADLRRVGAEPLAQFTLRPDAWTTDYYLPLAEHLRKLKVKHADDPEALAVFDHADRELAIHRRFGHAYGYVFFIFR